MSCPVGRILAPLLLALLLATPVQAQSPAVVLPEPAIPNFWDPRAPREPVELPSGRTIRFLTSPDFPPLHFLGADGVPTGFVVEVARAACVEAGVACTIQARPFETLLPALAAGEGDAVAAALRITAELREDHAVTAPFFRFPARLAAPAAAAAGFDVEAVEAARVGVVAGTAHEAYVETFWPGATRVPAQTLAEAQEGLRAGETDLLFADGLALALWVGGRASEGCCTLVSGPFLDSRFFGEGIGFIFRPGDARLAEAFDAALARLWAQGTYAEIYLRFFPVGPF
ncbi:transporter substrate-binding domain-containing protein [Salinarimonas rosea]|uniref:transporter substrate-binding domain-containing protein n=1 Tax=Salinarimonas rosea TaxID=552063 RepID=UPI00040F733C|nr:transporter substrate-binding domain-containing protein [Salinarimonas rosea]